ncbi:GTP cyclohydrolase I [Polaribacter irgensii 23-P]|uniref:GTP cyclohydrolase I n=1 Tax=Polaribacter irgensii 23-P TaxID=313594 RepID=A4C0M0_9FLAO|nr:GTP cyclohydrolase I [Polaribacter irgensii 23-P]
MYVKKLFYGLNPANKPKLSIFENKYSYKKMLIEQNITIDSACEHHFLPIIGHANVAYIPKDRGCKF